MMSEEDQHITLITSDRYKTAIKQKLIDDIIREGAEQTGLTLLHVLVILAVLQVCMTLITIYVIEYL